MTSNTVEKAYQLSLDPDYLSLFAVSALNNGIQVKGKPVEKAYQLSFNPDYLSPFAVSALNNGIQVKGKL